MILQNLMSNNFFFSYSPLQTPLLPNKGNKVGELAFSKKNILKFWGWGVVIQLCKIMLFYRRSF